MEQPHRDIRRVLRELGRERIVAEDRKFKFLVQEVQVCGHIRGGGRRRPEPGKLMAVEKWEILRTVSALQGFLGFANYYAAYVPRYAELVADLAKLLKVGREDGKKGNKKQ